MYIDNITSISGPFDFLQSVKIINCFFQKKETFRLLRGTDRNYRSDRRHCDSGISWWHDVGWGHYQCPAEGKSKKRRKVRWHLYNTWISMVKIFLCRILMISACQMWRQIPEERQRQVLRKEKWSGRVL